MDDTVVCGLALGDVGVDVDAVKAGAVDWAGR
jgi:hypothetical protein